MLTATVNRLTIADTSARTVVATIYRGLMTVANVFVHYEKGKTPATVILSAVWPEHATKEVTSRPTDKHVQQDWSQQQFYHPFISENNTSQNAGVFSLFIIKFYIWIYYFP